MPATAKPVRKLAAQKPAPKPTSKKPAPAPCGDLAPGRIADLLKALTKPIPTPSVP